jgi:hypothetical protein
MRVLYLVIHTTLKLFDFSHELHELHELRGPVGGKLAVVGCCAGFGDASAFGGDTHSLGNGVCIKLRLIAAVRLTPVPSVLSERRLHFWSVQRAPATNTFSLTDTAHHKKMVFQ